jgi:lipopolysaccharide exporter
MQLGLQIALARILGPEQFGLFAIGALVVGFSTFFADFGIAYGLIQKERVTSEDVRFVFTWQVVVGVSVAAAVAAMSVLLARFFGEPRSGQVILALSGVCFLNAVAAPSLNLLKRDLDFRSVQMGHLLGYGVGYGLVALPLALKGAGVWSLVAAWIVQSLVLLFYVYAKTRHPVTPLWAYSGGRKISSYGFLVLVTNLANWVIQNVDRIIIARLFSSAEVGLYSTAFTILHTPTSSLLGVVQPVFFSASSRITSEPGRIVSAYRSLVAAITVFVLPCFASLALIADTFVHAVYGEQWRGAAVALAPLALCMPLFLLWGITTPLLWAGGQPKREFRSQLPLAVFWCIACVVAAHVSLAAVAWAVFVLYAIRCVTLVHVARGVIGMSGQDVWKAARPGIWLSVTCGFAVAAIDHAMRDHIALPAFLLAMDILVGGVVLLSGLLLIPQVWSEDLRTLVQKIGARLPPWVLRLIRAATARGNMT